MNKKERELIRHWIKNGIDREAVDQAYIWGWNLVSPKHKIESLEQTVKLVKKVNGKPTTVFEKSFNELTSKEVGDLVNDNRSDALTTSQIRIVFGELKRIQTNGFSKGTVVEFLLLKPKLAYAVKRHDKKGLDFFYLLFIEAYNSVDTANSETTGADQFKNLMNLMEAVLAYHKYHGGKE